MHDLQAVEDRRLIHLVWQGIDLQKCDHEAKLQEKNRRRRTGQGTRANGAKKTSTRVNPQPAQSVAVQSRVTSTAQTVKPKLLKCTECGVSGAEEWRLFSGAHVICITSAAVRYKLELESFELCRASNITSSSHRRSASSGLNNDQPVDRHVPRSLADAILYATVLTRDQFPKLCTPSGSIQGLRRPKKKPRHHT